jgi:hypothetical protein
LVLFHIRLRMRALIIDGISAVRTAAQRDHSLLISWT